MVPEIVEIDVFKLTKYGSLKLRERNWFNDRQVETAKIALQLAAVAQAMALDLELDPLEALNLVSNPQPGDVRLVPYAADLNGVPNALDRQMRQTGEAVTMFFKSRLPSDFLATNSQVIKQKYGFDVDPNSGWLDAYTQELPEATIEQVVEFMNLETNRWKPIPEAQEEDSLGNESSGGEKPSTTTTKNTAPIVTGASN